ncbi:hypothetical protein TVAG_332920 [Trichomonas vaginalis G3]|uniref:CPC1/SPEF2 domain-containing protein n=1 Tax=Trichomonas vaginalis (strain ATCC PRA-98 / G3) TaxID=412133 RepID=A2EH88_TRIV3|nr:KPL2-related family [Trichomonas vaginalis G3]EAY07967.1 hypothetical protein TVAG_332920 [Trichomonas vaginalis G3]KAI5486014.1 KPL2-related family [Trichomonas vaginalis G3]|eukprot:XP_001320190.1 hypothetical protein [Trichomonas vaginalis G3]
MSELRNSLGTRSPRITTPQLNQTKNKSVTTLKVKNMPNARLFVDKKEGIRTMRLRELEAAQEREEKERLEREADKEPNVFTILKERREEEENCLDFLDVNRRILRQRNSDLVDDRLNADYQHYLYKYIRYQAENETTLKAELKEAYSNKQKFSDNRSHRNDQYLEQRKKDYAISQKRVQMLIQKLRDEYRNNVNNALSTIEAISQESNNTSMDMINTMSQNITNGLVSSALALQKVADVINFVPFFYNELIPHFQANGLVFDINNQQIPQFHVTNYMKSLPNETNKVFTTILETFQPESMTPKILSRQCRAICVVTKPLVFSDEQKAKIAETLGWNYYNVENFNNAAEEIFTLLSTTTEDALIFGFPRTPSEAQDLFNMFNPQTDKEVKSHLLPRPVSSEITPFDKIIELDVSDRIIVEDVYSSLVNPEGQTYDVRTLDIQDENQLTQLRSSPDENLDIPQFPMRSVTMKTNFDLLREEYAKQYETIELHNREITDDLINQLASVTEKIEMPQEPQYPPNILIDNLSSQIANFSPELKEFFVNQWKGIEERYESAISRVFSLVNQLHVRMVDHLTKARSEMLSYLFRPGNSQQHVIEFQQWHCTQVERGMRRMSKVKDECNLRLNSLREQLISIENDRKSEEEYKQKDLMNSSFRTTLFETISNAYTMLAQAEIDRWTSCHNMIMDINQIIVNLDLAVPLPRKKLPLIVDSKTDKRKSAKKPARTTPLSKSRLENKLPPFETPITENIDTFKKFVSDASCIYIPSTAPLSTRAKKPVKDKNPLAPHKINAIDEVQNCLRDDDSFIVSQLDRINAMCLDEIQAIQQAFDSYVEDSSNWISSHYEKRKAIADTAVAFMFQKVNDEQQLNQLILFSDENCVIDYSQLLSPNEESPKIPAAFPEDAIKEASDGHAENLYQIIATCDEQQTVSN